MNNEVPRCEFLKQQLKAELEQFFGHPIEDGEPLSSYGAMDSLEMVMVHEIVLEIDRDSYWDTEWTSMYPLDVTLNDITRRSTGSTGSLKQEISRKALLRPVVDSDAGYLRQLLLRPDMIHRFVFHGRSGNTAEFLPKLTDMFEYEVMIGDPDTEDLVGFGGIYGVSNIDRRASLAIAIDEHPRRVNISLAAAVILIDFAFKNYGIRRAPVELDLTRMCALLVGLPD